MAEKNNEIPTFLNPGSASISPEEEYLSEEPSQPKLQKEVTPSGEKLRWVQRPPRLIRRLSLRRKTI